MRYALVFCTAKSASKCALCVVCCRVAVITTRYEGAVLCADAMIAVVLGAALAWTAPHGAPLGRTIAGRTWRVRAARSMLLDDEAENFLAGERAAGVVSSLCTACKEIALAVRTASCDSTACFNDFGDARQQLAVDVVAEETVMRALRGCGEHVQASTMLGQAMLTFGVPPPELGSPSPEFAVVVDSLDGASIIDANFAVGSLFAVWEAPSVLNGTGRTLAAAGACSYGPRTALYLALGGCGGSPKSGNARESLRWITPAWSIRGTRERERNIT